MPEDEQLTGRRKPLGVRTITIDEMDRLGVGADGRLYWDDKPVEVQKSLTLTFGQKIWASLLSAAGLLAAGATVIQGWVAWQACQ